MKRVAIFHWGELSIHAYYLAAALKQQNISIDLYLYSPREAYKRNFLINLLKKVKNEINTIEFKCSFIESCLIKLNRISALFGRQLPALFTNPFLPVKTRRRFKNTSYNYIITIGQTSLYWLYKTDKQSLQKTFHYSLEIQKTSDPDFITPPFASILNWEMKLLKKIKGLIIQDAFRAEALLNCKIENSNLIFFFLPVSILGKRIKRGSNYLFKNLNIPKEKKILLYFGALYTERYIGKISETFNKQLNNSWVLVLHGPHNFSGIIIDETKIKASHNLLDYDAVHLITSSATIGLAIYDNSWANTRFTAFSSEKIARYLQAGVPFIAFENESYLKLKNEFNCCALINHISDLSAAMEAIMEEYESYRANCFKAFDKYYNIQNSILPLTYFINNIHYHSLHFNNYIK
jgi:hypothetical protein